MFYHIHIVEDNVPFGDKPYSHDIFLRTDNDIDIEDLEWDINDLKTDIDISVEEEELHKYCDYGWHEKIDVVVDMLSKKYGYKVLDFVISSTIHVD